ncbi:MAG: HAD hydrolase family protein [Oscillospiraceae bacterium]|nr:HAD hydrolase family protein [Oscillospiraceae bacterium]
MNRKLLFLDIDGTLTVPGTNVPPDSALRAIRAARAAGHKVFLCTGRNRGMLSPLLQYGFDGYVGSSGGYVVCGEKVLYDCPMTEDRRRLAMDLFRENGVFRTVEGLEHSWCDEGLSTFMGSVGGGNSELERWRRALEAALGILPMAQYDGSPIYKIIFMCENEGQLAPARAALEEDFQFVIQDAPAPGCVNGELVNRRFDKGGGVRRVAEALGADIADTVGFGDSMNDLEMIQTVGYSVCMENGSPALKAASNMVCPAVEQDGLARAFRDLGLVEC